MGMRKLTLAVLLILTIAIALPANTVHRTVYVSDTGELGTQVTEAIKLQEVPLDVVPLLESTSALEGAGPVLKSLLAEPSYRRHLAARGGRQTVLLGFGEGNQAIGIAAARHAIYQAQVELIAAADEAGLDLALFYGRGGPSSRGGGPIERLVESAPDGSTRGRLRATSTQKLLSETYMPRKRSSTLASRYTPLPAKRSSSKSISTRWPRANVMPCSLAMRA